ncbi:MAG: HD domain-containing protein [Candidatus Margulisiibacteriota bacterium]|nr:HD domain-containing protein [Candidatus Margulisiibacteriota bacterium]
MVSYALIRVGPVRYSRPDTIYMKPSRARRQVKKLADMPRLSSKGSPIIGSKKVLITPSVYLDTTPPANYADRLKKLRCYGPMLEKAVVLAWNAHKKIFRKSGDLYFEHLVSVVELADAYGLKGEAVAAAICHDLIEDTNVTKKMIAELLGGRVAKIVYGVTEFGKEHGFEGTAPTELDKLSKRAKSGAEEPAIILITIFDRLHNMRTLEHMGKEAQRLKAEETQNFHAKIADRLGMWEIKREMEDLAFKYLEPEKYNQINDRLDLLESQSREQLDGILGKMRSYLDSTGLHCDFVVERRHIYETYQRMQRRGIDRIENILAIDIWRINLVVPEEADCHIISGKIENLYPPVQDERFNFIAEPRPNGHQFLHSYLKVPEFGNLLVQIRSKKMQRNHKLGVLSEGKDVYEFQYAWLDIMVDIIQEKGVTEASALHRIQHFSAPIIVYTPEGRLIELPFGATPIDAAYYIHSDMLINTVGAEIERRPASLFQRLKHGQTVRIFTDPKSRPSISWLDHARSPKTRNRLRKYFRSQVKDVQKTNGREALDKALTEGKFFVNADMLIGTSLFKKYVSVRYGRRYKSEEFLRRIGKGEIKARDVVKGVNDYYLEVLGNYESRHSKLQPYYISIKAENKKGLIRKLAQRFEDVGYDKKGYDLGDILTVFPKNEPGMVILAIGPKVFGGQRGGGMIGQIQRKQIIAIAESFREAIEVKLLSEKERSELWQLKAEEMLTLT